MSQFPKTSLEAYKSQTDEKLNGDYARIIEALGYLGKANYETIANAAKMDRHAVGRRMKELESKEMVYKPGTTSETRTGRKAYDYCLTSPVKVAQKIKSAHQNLTVIQNTLFTIK